MDWKRDFRFTSLSSFDSHHIFCLFHIPRVNGRFTFFTCFVDEAPAFSDSVRLSLWTDVLRVQSLKAGLVSEEKKFIHWFILLSRAAASCFTGLLLGSQNRTKCHSFTLCFYSKERVGCRIWRRHYKWPLFLSALALIVPF